MLPQKRNMYKIAAVNRSSRSVFGVAASPPGPWRSFRFSACCWSETVRPQRRLYAPWKWRIPSSASPGGGRQSSRRGAAFGLLGGAKWGGATPSRRAAIRTRASRCRRRPRPPRTRVEYRPWSRREWRRRRICGETRRVSPPRALQDAPSKPTRDRQALRHIHDSPHPHQLAQPQKLTGYAAGQRKTGAW